jgi:hypothetical protein
VLRSAKIAAGRLYRKDREKAWKAAEINEFVSLVEGGRS